MTLIELLKKSAPGFSRPCPSWPDCEDVEGPCLSCAAWASLRPEQRELLSAVPGLLEAVEAAKAYFDGAWTPGWSSVLVYLGPLFREMEEGAAEARRHALFISAPVAPAVVHVLTWDHKHGSEATVYATEALALEAAAGIISERLEDVIEIGVDYPDARAGSDHEEDVVGGRARCAVCGWVDEADPDDEVVMEYHGDSFPEREPAELTRKALAEGRIWDAMALYNENACEDSIGIEAHQVLTGPEKR